MLNSQHWPKVDGKIETVSFVLSGSKPSTSNEKLSYSYNVDGQEYENDRVYFGIAIASKNKPLSYQEGEHVYVYYNPDSPGESVLRPNDMHSIIFSGIAGVAFVVFFLIGYWFDQRKA